MLLRRIEQVYSTFRRWYHPLRRYPPFLSRYLFFHSMYWKVPATPPPPRHFFIRSLSDFDVVDIKTSPFSDKSMMIAQMYETEGTQILHLSQTPPPIFPPISFYFRCHSPFASNLGDHSITGFTALFSRGSGMQFQGRQGSAETLGDPSCIQPDRK